MVWARIRFKASYFNRTKFIMMSCSKNFSSGGDLFFFVFFLRDCFSYDGSIGYLTAHNPKV